MTKNMRNLLTILFTLLLFAGCKTSEKTSGSKKTKSSGIVQKELTPKEHEAFSAVYINANRAKILGNLEEADRLFRKALDIDPGSAAARYEIARIYASDKNYLGAIPFAKDANQIDPENIWYAKLLGQLYSETGQLEKSIAVFEDIIRKHPNKFDNYFTLGSLFSAQGKYDEALDLYEKLENKTGSSEEITLQKQMIFIDKGDYQSALNEIDTLISQHPDEIRLYGMKAEIYQKLEKPQKARALYEEMLDMDPDNGLVLLSLHDIAQRNQETDKAEEYLRRAFSSPELNVDVKVNILLNYLSAPNFNSKKEQVLELTRRMEAANPGEAKTFAVAGDIYYNLNQLDSARAKFRKAVKLDPNRPPIWQQILTIDSQLNDFDAMETESAKALEYFPQQPVFYLFNGIALLQKEKASEAVDQLTAGKNLVVDDPAMLGQFYASLGDAYHELENHTESDKAYDKALKYDPNNVIVLNNYAYYLSLRDENLERAEQMAQKANDLSPDVASFQDTYGWVLYKNENYQNALFWIEEALKNGGENDPTVLNHHGDVLLKLNRKAEAVKSWQKALDAGGDSDEIEPKIAEYSSP